MMCFDCHILFLLFSFMSTASSNNHYNVCGNAIGLEDGKIKDEQLSASSYRSYLFVRDKGTFNAKAKFGRLNGLLAWCAINPSRRYRRPSPYFQVYFHRPVNVSGLATQGLSSTWSLYFMKSYAIKFSLDGNLWFNYSSPNKVWFANNDPSTIRRVYFDKPILANYLRIYPLTYSYRICLRAEIYGCYANETGSSTQPTESSSQPEVTYRGPTTQSLSIKKKKSHMTHIPTTSYLTMKKTATHMTRQVPTTPSLTMKKIASSKPNFINSSLPLGKPDVKQSRVLVMLSPSSGGMPSSRRVQGENAWMERNNSIVIGVVVCIGFVILCILSFIIFLVWRRKQRRDVHYSQFQMLGHGGVAESEGSYKIVEKFV